MENEMKHKAKAFDKIHAKMKDKRVSQVDTPKAVWENSIIKSIKNRLPDFTVIKTSELQALKDEREKLKGLLKIAKCPNTDCKDGAIPHQLTADNWIAEQCQWCYEKDELLKYQG